jgi:hypothetical protein
VALLQSLAAAAAAGWGLAWVTGPQSAATALGALLAAATVLVRVAPWRPRPAVALVWDGSVWRVDGVPGPLRVSLDLGPWMLLRLQAGASGRFLGARTHWLPVSAAEAGASWHALRVAAHAGDGAAAMPSAPHV